MDYLIAFAVCAAAAAFEGLCAGRDPMAQLRATRQPSWSPPAWAWVLVGLAWYAICFTALSRLLPFWPERKAPVLLLGAMMLLNGAVNLLQFRMKRLDLAFASLFPYWLLLGAFLWIACALDGVACGLFGGYAVYQVYAGLWQYRLWRMNRGSS